MKILLIDTMAAWLDFALRAEAQGHEVRWFNQWQTRDGPIPTGKGLITRIDNWQSSMKWADLILTSDNTKYLIELEKYRKEGYPIFGCNVECAEWELERAVGQKVLEDAGIPVLPSIRFNNYDEAITYLQAHATERFVCKPLGDAAKELSYVSKSSQDLLFMLQYWKKTQPKPVPFIFQKFTAGTEMAVGGYMGRNGFASYVQENFEHKKLMNDEVGVNTGEMGTVIKYCTFEESRLAQQMLRPIEAQLIRNGYTGYIDVAVIIDEKGDPQPLEFTCRPGWPLTQIMQVLHPDICCWMKDLLEGRDTFAPHTDVSVGVVVCMPDFPYGRIKAKELSGFPVWGITEKNRYWVHPCEMMLGEGPVLEGNKIKTQPMLVSAGNYVLVVTGAAPTISAAQDMAYEHLAELEIPNSPLYRTDIGSRLKGQIADLQKLGYATSWKW